MYRIAYILVLFLVLLQTSWSTDLGVSATFFNKQQIGMAHIGIFPIISEARITRSLHSFLDPTNAFGEFLTVRIGKNLHTQEFVGGFTLAESTGGSSARHIEPYTILGVTLFDFHIRENFEREYRWVGFTTGSYTLDVFHQESSVPKNLINYNAFHPNTFTFHWQFGLHYSCMEFGSLGFMNIQEPSRFRKGADFSVQTGLMYSLTDNCYLSHRFAFRALAGYGSFAMIINKSALCYFPYTRNTAFKDWKFQFDAVFDWRTLLTESKTQEYGLLRLGLNYYY